MNEWLCLTCQMQRALKAAETAEPQMMKSQALPNKVSTPVSQKKDIISTQKAEVLDKIQKDSTTAGAPQKKEETKQPPQMHITQASIPGAVSDPTKEEKTSPAPIIEVPVSTVPPAKETADPVKDLNKPLPSLLPETSVQKNKDITPVSSPATKKVLEKEGKDVQVQKPADKPVTSTDEVKPQQALIQESKPVETSTAKSVPLAAKPINQESVFPSFGSPKSQRAASITTEAVTGKMFGFGSSLFSSASTLITSAVQESRTTPPSTRKMSAPAQVSDKMSTSPKPSPPPSPRMTSEREAKPQAQKPHQENIQDQPQQAKAPPSGQAKVNKGPEPAKPEASQAAPKVLQSTCPLCKAQLNMGSKDPPNYNTCTECKASVCNKCGFSPMPNVTQVI